MRSASSFLVHGVLWVSALVPSAGPVGGGTRVSVVGSTFRDGATLRCRFDAGLSSSTSARRVSVAQLECATPVQAGASSRVVEVSMNAQQFSSSGVSFTYVAAASVSSVWPERGASEGGTPVTLYGANLLSVSEQLGYLQCRFNSTVVRGSLVGDDTLVCNSTSTPAGVVSVEVTTNGRDFSASGVQYEFVSVLVSEVTPWSGPELGGTLVTLVGGGFGDVELSCRFGDEASVLASVHGAESVRCVSPSGAPTGWASVELLSHGETLRSGGSFFFHARMWVSAVAPLLGPVEGGTRLSLLGSHFREAATLRCRFEESSATVVARYVDSSQLECATPVQAGASSRVVEVSMNAQQFSSSGVAFTYVAAAAVSSVWPERGASEGGTPVTLHGANLLSVSEQLGYLQCRFNSTVVRGSLVGDDTLVCNSTSTPAGVVSVEVTTNGRDFSASGVQYEFVSVLVSEVTPWSGPELGGTLVTLVGGGFGDVELSCRFGDEASVLASVHGAESVRCVSPSGAPTGWASVELLSHGETLRSGGSFFFHARMWVSAVAPLLGPVEGGTRLSLLGSQFREAATLRCRFEESSATVVARYIDVEPARVRDAGAGWRVVSRGGGVDERAAVQLERRVVHVRGGGGGLVGVARARRVGGRHARHAARRQPAQRV